MKRTKVWITGAEGAVGTELTQMLDCMDVEILPTNRDVDVTSLEKISLFADVNHPDVIINCAALTGLRRCEENVEMAYRVNALGARNVSVAARKANAKVIHLSTDDVFSGVSGQAYNEFDATCPVSIYGRSKLAGEAFVRELNPKHVIVRSAWTYGIRGDNFARNLLEEARSSEVIQVPQDQIGSPTSAKELARLIIYLMDTNEYGVYHAVCEGSCTRAEFARAVLDRTGYSGVRVEAVPAETLGQSSSGILLDNLMLRLTGDYVMPRWEDALDEFARDWEQR